MFEKVITQLFNFDNIRNVDKPIKIVNSIINIKDSKDVRDGKDSEEKIKNFQISNNDIYSNNIQGTEINLISCRKTGNMHSSKVIVDKDNKGNSLVAIRKVLRDKGTDNRIFKIKHHFILGFLPCFIQCSVKLKTKNEQFLKLVGYVYNYLDVLQMVKHFHEIDKLKFVLFNKKQLSVFLNIGLPDDPLQRVKSLKINNMYDFQNETEKQNKKIMEFFKNENKINSDIMNKRLKKLYIGQ